MSRTSSERRLRETVPPLMGARSATARSRRHAAAAPVFIPGHWGIERDRADIGEPDESSAAGTWLPRVVRGDVVVNVYEAF